MVRRINDDLHAIAAAAGAQVGTPGHGSVIRLADDQMAVLVELLTPGYELAQAYLASQKQPNAAEIEADRFDDTKEQAQTLEETTPAADLAGGEPAQVTDYNHTSGESAASAAVLAENQQTDGGKSPEGDSGAETK